MEKKPCALCGVPIGFDEPDPCFWNFYCRVPEGSCGDYLISEFAKDLLEKEPSLKADLIAFVRANKSETHKPFFRQMPNGFGGYVICREIIPRTNPLK